MGVLLELDATNRVPKSKKSRYSKSRDPGIGPVAGVAFRDHFTNPATMGVRDTRQQMAPVLLGDK